MEYEVLKELDYRKILLDPFNPRFDGELEGMTQSQIIERIKKDSDYKELIESMKRSIRWINLIVIRPIDDLDANVKENLNVPDINKYKYIVIEGNTRLACLHDDDLTKKSNNIPVSIFKLGDEEKKDDLKRDEYNLEIMYIQGQANILKVKDWNDKPKCQHVYRTFIERKKLNNSEKTTEIINDLAKRFSGKVSDIKKALVRCSIVRKFESIGYKIDEKDWSYLEAIETKVGNTYMGLNADYEFDSNLDPKNQKILLERYEKFYNLVQKYKGENLNSKKFRDYFRKNYLNKPNENIPLEIPKTTKTVSIDNGNNAVGVDDNNTVDGDNGNNTVDGGNDNNDVNVDNDNNKDKEHDKKNKENDFKKNQNRDKINAKIKDEYNKQKKDIDYRKSINIEGKNIYAPHTEIDVYSNFILLKHMIPKSININIPSYNQKTTYDSLAYYDNDDQNLFWCEFKKVLPRDITNCIEHLHTIICWEISHNDIYANFIGTSVDGNKINLKLQKHETNPPGYKFKLVNEEKDIKVEIVELRDIWEMNTKKKFI